jgi:hypothetical protein
MTIHDLNKPAINLFEEGVFPSEWRLVPLLGKAPKIKDWPTSDYRGKEFIKAYWSRQHSGIGVLTGAPSGGLIALDIDGPAADARLQAALGEAYEPAGKESSMSWTSGKAGRRQVLYKVPEGMTTLLSKVVKLALDPATGKWGKAPDKDGGDEKYEEVVLRFNRCQSVLPGSAHPETKKKYRFLNYNEGVVSKAPDWMVDILMEHTSPDIFVEQKWQAEAEDKVGNYITTLPDSQMRGWLFREDGGFAKLRPQLLDLVFNHEVHDRYGWEPKDDESCQMVSGCPWHGGESGTAFQMRMDTGVWICHGCGVGGDLIDYIHKINTGDKHASKPTGPDLEAIVGKLATDLGERWPECAMPTQKVQQVAPQEDLTAREFYERVGEILEKNEVREEAHFALMTLVYNCGRQWQFRSGAVVEASYNRYRRQSEGTDEMPLDWAQQALKQKKYLIPGLLSIPNSVMLHAKGGLGKTRAAISLAKVVGEGRKMHVRGSDVYPNMTGNVLFIGTDMSECEYADYFLQQDIDPATTTWLKFKPKWQQDELTKMYRWIKQYKPVMVIIDSLGTVSNEIEAKENEREYANGVYELARENGRSFPATCFLWIHHNTKGGEGSTFRGTDALRNAVSETWEMKEIKGEDLVTYGPQAALVVVDKSRSGRAGDRFLMNTDVNENVSVRDLTPEVSTYKDSQVVKAKDLVLDALRGKKAGLTAKGIFEYVQARQVGAGEEPPKERTVERWIANWASQGLILDSGERAIPETGGGRPAVLWVHVENLTRESRLSFNRQTPSDPLHENGFSLRQVSDIPPFEPGLSEAVSETPPETDETLGEFPTFSPTTASHEGGNSPLSETKSIPAQGFGEFPTKSPAPKDRNRAEDPFATIETLPIEVLREMDETETEGG